MASATRPDFPSLDQNEHAAVCIVGAGVAGLTSAYLLTKAGKTVIVLDDGPIFSGESERTTAHLVTVLDKRYFELEQLHAESGAKLAAQSHAAAIDMIERIVLDEQIACNFERVDGYLFNTPDQPPDLLDRELAAVRRAGITNAELVDRAPPTSFDTGRALRFRRQAQFSPQKYLSALAQCIIRDGGRIFTDTHATKFAGGKPAQVTTRGGSTVSCEAIVIATHTPVNDWMVLHAKQAAYRSYVIGIAVPAGTVPKALYWDTGDPYHYVRIMETMASGTTPALDILLVGGEDHRTGQADDAEIRYMRLEQWARQRFPMAAEVRFRWSGQIIQSVDGLAFIGRNPLDHENVYVVTGDSGTGIMHGTIAGIMFTDLIQGRENPWTDLYSPARVTLGAATDLALQAVNTASQYIDWLTAGDLEKDELVPIETGAIVRHGLKKVAVYRDSKGALRECCAVCPHLGGIVAWNHAENTWDCPAHGSRFDPLGTVLNGPANENLQSTGVAAASD
jgi:glycine/D-amino acid oxidase-like deaminating enzyme/nitrite reductase/ring-hydroxylating ferredoxin subunit